MIKKEEDNSDCYAIRLIRADGTLHGYQCSKCGGGWSVYTSQPTCYCGDGPSALRAGRIKSNSKSK